MTFMPGLGIAEREVAKVARGKFVLLPVSSATHGHGTHTWAAAWTDQLHELLAMPVSRTPHSP